MTEAELRALPGYREHRGGWALIAQCDRMLAAGRADDRYTVEETDNIIAYRDGQIDRHGPPPVVFVEACNRETDARSPSGAGSFGTAPGTTHPLTAIEQARPYIDAGPHDERAWRPSHLIQIGYFIILSSHNTPERADLYVSEMLGEARNRYAAGFYANPFAEPVIVRSVNAA